MTPGAPVVIQDVTLREGLQAADVAFSPDDKKEFARRLAVAGFRRVQAGYAGSDDATVAALKQAVPALELSVLVVAWRPDWEEAARSAAAAGADVLMLLLRIAPRQLEAIGFSTDRALERIDAAVRHMAKLAPVVSFDPSFVTLADPGFLRQAYTTAAAAGAADHGIADSTGVATPERMAELVTTVRDITGGTVGVHCHNDFGLALANTLSAIAAGASLADASFLGLGERAGNCATEELAVALELLRHSPTGVRLEDLTGIASFVSEVSRVPIPASKAVVGADAFSQKLDMHVAMTRRDPTLLEPFPPERVGNRRHLRLGLGTGPLAVQTKLEELGLPSVSDAEAITLAAWINDTARSRHAAVSDGELRERVTA